MKLCINCKHCVGKSFPECHRLAKEMLSPVDGRPIIVGQRRCDDERDGIEAWKCGPDGKFFEEKA